jgi:7-cyano-7-deazaguanine synthase
MKSRKLILLLSGGMDSSVLLFMAGRQDFAEVHTLTLDYGQRHGREIECVSKQLNDAKLKYPNTIFTNKVLDVKYLKDISPTSSLTNLEIDNPDISKIAGDAQPASYVPFRNQMFLSICCAYAESMQADTIWYGAAQVDSLAGYWDTTDYFISSFNKLISQNRKHQITIEAPLLEMSKADIVNEGIECNINFADTWTCYSNREDGLADATTPSSSLRIRGFIEAGYRDPIQYVQQDSLDELYQANNCRELHPIVS